jgi:hypothetical protein
MQNLLPKAAVLAIIAGGFALTGDLGWITDRGLRVLDAADVALPAARDEEPVAGPVAAPAQAAVSSGREPQTLPAASPVEPAGGPPTAAPQAAAARAVAHAPLTPPAAGCVEVRWSSLAAGDRVTVWLAGAGPRCLVLDVVDQASGEAVAYEAAALTADGRPAAAATPPRRVVVGHTDGPAAITKGGMLHLAPGGIAAAGEAGLWLGPVEAVTLAQ